MNVLRRICVVLFISNLSFWVNGPVYAGNTQKTEALTQQVYEKIKEAQDLAQLHQYQQALEKMQLLRGEKLSQYELSQSWNLTAYIHYLQGNYQDAVDTYRKVLDYDKLAIGVVQSTLKTISQLYFALEDYSSALRNTKRLMALIENPGADVYMLLGQAYYQLKDYNQALAPIKTGISLHEAQGKTPKENWLLLLRGIYHEKNQYSKMIPVLKKLISHYPKDRYLLSLAGIYSQLGESEKQLSLTQALYDKGLLVKESNLVNLANLYILHGLPIKAADLMEKEMAAGTVSDKVRHVRLLALALQMAREHKRALVPLERAASRWQTGELYVRLAQSYLQLERWSAAEQSLNKAMKKGGLKQLGQANLMLGMAQFNQQKFELARKAFERSEKTKHTKKSATQWLAYLDSEIARLRIQSVGAPGYQRNLESDQMIKELEG